MARKVTRTLLVVVTAPTLAVGALGVSGGFGSGWATPEASALTVSDTGGDASSGGIGR
jgi:hypothetical protein